MLDISRVPQAAKRLSYSTATYYRHAATGLVPPPFKIGPGASAVPDREIDAVMRARLAGKNDEEIRELVRDLVAQRAEIIEVGAA